MDYPEAETIILNDEEFIFLLAAAGIEDWFGIDLAKKVSFINDERKINFHLAELYRKGMIDWGEHKARLSETAEPIFRVLKSAQVCIMCSGTAIPGLISGSYCSEGKVVMIERGIASAEELRITYTGAEEWYSYFAENEFFPNVTEAPFDLDPECLYPDADDKITDFEVRSIPEGRMLENVMLFDCGLYGMIIDNTTHNSIRKMFSTDVIKTIMFSWAGGTSR